MKKTSWRSFFNKLVLICGAVALMAVASGASVGSLVSNDPGTQAPEENANELVPQAIEKCEESNLFQQVVNFQRKNAVCKTDEFAKSETCPWTICRNDGLKQ